MESLVAPVFSQASISSACDQLIFSGEYTRAMDKEFHAEHFACWDCDKNLTGQAYILREEHPYCIACYEKLFSNTCEKCAKLIGTDSKDLSYKEKHWHEWCFVCCICSNSLVDKPFGSKEDKIYCGDCYANEFASRCDGCSQVFKPGTKKMEYKGKQWHENCFTCNNCKKALGTQSFIPKDEHNYCVTCYEELFATKCTKCKKSDFGGWCDVQERSLPSRLLHVH